MSSNLPPTAKPFSLPVEGIAISLLDLLSIRKRLVDESFAERAQMIQDPKELIGHLIMPKG
jgi:hypothetical protein